MRIAAGTPLLSAPTDRYVGFPTYGYGLGCLAGVEGISPSGFGFSPCMAARKGRFPAVRGTVTSARFMLFGRRSLSAQLLRRLSRPATAALRRLQPTAVRKQRPFVEGSANGPMAAARRHFCGLSGRPFGTRRPQVAGV